MELALLDEKILEQKWLELIIEARKLGISIEEISDFLKQSS